MPPTITVLFEEMSEPPPEAAARYRRMLAILRQYRRFLTPEPEAPKLEPIPVEERRHD